VGALGLLTFLMLSLLMSDHGFDDPYITYRYTSNLLDGHGLVYNMGQRILSTTAPFYALVLALLGLLWPDLPTLSNVLSALSMVLSAAFLLGISAGRGERAAGMISALLLSLSPYLLFTFGAETCFSIMLILGGFYAYDRSHYTLAAGVLAVAAMVRPDGLVAGLALAVYHLARRHPIPWRAAGAYVVLTAGWFVGLWLYFGSPIPITLMVKQQQGELAISTRFWEGLIDVVRGHGREPLYWLHGLLALIGVGRVAIKAHHWLPLLLWTLLYIVAYSFLGVSRYFWYYAPLMPAFFVLVGQGVTAVLETLRGTKLPRLGMIGTTGLLLLALVAPLLMGTMASSWSKDHRLELYHEIGEWLERHTPQDASVGLLEVGIVGYYAQRSIVDFAGLIQPEVARRFTPTTTYPDSATWTIREYEPDYVLLHQDSFSDVAEDDWFRRSYVAVRTFASPPSLVMTLYQRSPAP
jgi:hypothetical protein